jgi:hypothetical protein
MSWGSRSFGEIRALLETGITVQECDANHYGMRGLAGDVGRNCPGEADLFARRVRDFI